MTTDNDTDTADLSTLTDEAKALRLAAARRLILDVAGGKLKDAGEISKRANECGIDVDRIAGLVKNYRDRAKALLSLRQAEQAERELTEAEEHLRRVKVTRDELVAENDKKLVSCDESMAAAAKVAAAMRKQASSLRAAGERILTRTDDPATVKRWEDLDARRKEIVARIDAARERETAAIDARSTFSDWVLGVKIPTGIYPAWHPSAGDAIPSTPTPRLSDAEVAACEDAVGRMESDAAEASTEIVGLQVELAKVESEVDQVERQLADPLGFAIFG